MSNVITFPHWDKKDIKDGVVVATLSTGHVIPVQDSKTKNPKTGKDHRVSKKMADGLYELTAAGLNKLNSGSRSVLGKEDLLGIFPMNDSRNTVKAFKDGLVADDIIRTTNAIIENGGHGLLLKIVEQDKLHPGLAKVHLVQSIEKLKVHASNEDAMEGEIA